MYCMTEASSLVTEDIIAEIGDALERSDIQFSLAYHALREDAQYAVSSALVAQVAPVLSGRPPAAPSVAAGTLLVVRRLLSSGREYLSPSAIIYLETLEAELGKVTSDRQARHREEMEMRRVTSELEELSSHRAGVYVYTFPHYWWNPSDAQDGLRLLRVCAAPGVPESSIVQQMRVNDMPEEHIVVRFYPSPDGQDPFDLVESFHDFLDASGYQRSQTSDAEPVWFSTDLDALDMFAYFLGLVGSEDSGMYIMSDAKGYDASAAPLSPPSRRTHLLSGLLLRLRTVMRRG